MNEKEFEIVINGQSIMKTKQSMLNYFLKCCIDAIRFDSSSVIELRDLSEKLGTEPKKEAKVEK